MKSIREALNPLSPSEFAAEKLDLILGENQKVVLDNFFAPEVTEMILLAGKGASKDFLTTVIFLYSIYRLNLIPLPERYLGQAAGSPIDIVCVGPSGRQTIAVFLSQLKARLKNSEYCFSLLRTESDDDILQDTVRFKHNITVYGLHSTFDSWEGMSIYLAALDEFSAFTSSSKSRNSKKVYDSVITSMLSRFGNKGKMVLMSYPRPPPKQDPTIIAYDEAIEKNDPSVLAYKFKTWELRPGKSKRDFKKFYERDLVMAKLTFECEDTFCGSNKLMDEMKIKLAMQRKNIKYSNYEGENSYIKLSLDEDFDFKSPYWVGMDAGLANDSFALAFGYPEGEKIIIENVLTWKPTPGFRVDFGDVLELLNRVNIVSLATDGWNSAFIIQQLESKGIFTKTSGVSRQDQFEMYFTLREEINTGTIILPKHDKLLEELRELEIFAGQKIDHPRNGSKDVADAVVMARLAMTSDNVSTEEPAWVSNTKGEKNGR